MASRSLLARRQLPKWRASVDLLWLLWVAALGVTSIEAVPGIELPGSPELGSERAVIQTSMGDIELAFFPTVAPVTAAHILKLFRLGCYNTNHVFRVDRGFVAQVADVLNGRQAPMNSVQREEGAKRVPGEFSSVKHTRGILSMGRHDDPNSATSSFSMLLGDAPHLDGKYAVFGRVTKGDEVLQRMEQVQTRTEGMFVMPVERISILSTYVYDVNDQGQASCEAEVSALRSRLKQTEANLEDARRKCLP